MEDKGRLINAYAAVIKISGKVTPILQKHGSKPRGIYLAVLEALAECPTVDAVEVTRCGKCRYRSQYADENGLYKCGGIQTAEGDLVLMVKPDFFCAFGERRTNDDN